MLVLLASLSTLSPVHALLDSVAKSSATLPHWSFDQVLMDTDDVRGCVARGTFGRLEIQLDDFMSMSRVSQMSFKFADSDRPNINFPGDQRSCGPGADQAHPGAVHYNTHNPSIEYCDGSAWLPVKEGFNLPARLLIAGKEVATAPSDSSFVTAVQNGRPVILKWSAWFRDIENVGTALNKPGRVEVRVPGLDPIVIPELAFDRVMPKFTECHLPRRSQK